MPIRYNYSNDELLGLFYKLSSYEIKRLDNQFEGTPKEKLRTVILSILGDTQLSDSVIVDYTSLHLLLMEGVKKFKPVREQYSEFYHTLQNFIKETVDEGVIQGTVRNDIDSSELATAIENSYGGKHLNGNSNA